MVGRLAVLVVAIIALMLAYTPNDTILGLVGNAWAGFGAVFEPTVLLSLYWKRMTKWGALAGMVVGGLTIVIWLLIPALSNSDEYELIPGFFLSLIAVIVVSIKTNDPEKQVQEQFEQMEEKMKE